MSQSEPSFVWSASMVQDGRHALGRLRRRVRRGLWQLRDIAAMVGPLRTLLVFPYWLIRRQYTVLVRELNDIRPPQAAPVFTHWTILTDDETASLCNMNPALAETEIRRRRGSGELCYLFWVGDTLAHYRWLADKPVYLPFLKKTLLLDRNDYLVSDVFTHPRFRKQGIFSATSQWCLYRAQKEGFSRSIAIVAAWNKPSLWVAQVEAQRYPVGTVRYWKIGPWTRHSVTGDVQLGEDDTIFIRGPSTPSLPF